MSYNGGYVSSSLSLLYPENMYAEYFAYATTGKFEYLDLA